MGALRRIALWSLAGTAVAPLDALHVASRTIVRSDGGPLAEVALFAAGGVVVGLLFHYAALPLARFAARPPHGPIPGRAARAVPYLAFLAAYASSSFVGTHALAATLAYAALFLASLAVTPPHLRLPGALFGLGAAFIGPGIEGSLSTLGSFAYARPDLWLVPMWLPALYLVIGPAVASFDELITASERPRRGFARLALLRTSMRRRA